MPYGLYVSAEGAMVQSKRLEVIANNVANVDTVGFKRDLALFQARYAASVEDGRVAAGSGTINDLGGGVQFQSTVTDYSSGPLKQTQMPTDVAIDGPGFLVVRRSDGDMLTRAGNLAVSSDNTLVNADGYPVLDAGGAPITIDPELPWRITADGAVEQGADLTNMAMVVPNSLSDLSKVGENLFRPLAPSIPLDPSGRHLLIGQLEASSVEPATEMMNMIETSRAFEANANMIRNQDSMLGTLIGRVLRASS